MLRAPLARLHRTRWSPEIQNSQWEYGANGAFLKDLLAYWQQGFDWRKQEAEINRREKELIATALRKNGTANPAA